MPVHVFMCPVLKDNKGTEPSLLTLARKQPGYRGSMANMQAGMPYCIYIVRADAIDDLETQESALKVSVNPQDRLDNILWSLDILSTDDWKGQKRKELVRMLTEIGFDRLLIGKSQGTLTREVIKHLNPAASDDMFDRKVQEIKSSISDNFNRPDAATLGSGWTANSGTMWQIVSQKARPVDSSMSTVIRSESEFPSDHYAQADMSDVTKDTGVIIRATASAWYKEYGVVTPLFINIRSDPGNVFIVDGSATAAAPDTVKLQAVGNQLTVFHNGAQIATAANATIPSGGKPGMHGNFPDATQDHDNFESTDASSGSLTLMGAALF